jgi:hypothetical protein
MECLYCHSESPEDSRFCRICGRSFASPHVEEIPSDAQSPAIGNQQQAFSNYSVGLKQFSAKISNLKSTQRRNLIIYAAIGVTVVIALIIYLFASANPLPAAAQSSLQQAASLDVTAYTNAYYDEHNESAPSNATTPSWSISAIQKASDPEQSYMVSEAWCVVITFSDPAGNRVEDDILISSWNGGWISGHASDQTFQNVGCTIGTSSNQ